MLMYLSNHFVRATTLYLLINLLTGYDALLRHGRTLTQWVSPIYTARIW
jgi:hypothetical protein